MKTIVKKLSNEEKTARTAVFDLCVELGAKVRIRKARVNVTYVGESQKNHFSTQEFPYIFAPEGFAWKTFVNRGSTDKQFLTQIGGLAKDYKYSEILEILKQGIVPLDDVIIKIQRRNEAIEKVKQILHKHTKFDEK